MEDNTRLISLLEAIETGIREFIALKKEELQRQSELYVKYGYLLDERKDRIDKEEKEETRISIPSPEEPAKETDKPRQPPELKKSTAKKSGDEIEGSSKEGEIIKRKPRFIEGK